MESLQLRWRNSWVLYTLFWTVVAALMITSLTTFSVSAKSVGGLVIFNSSVLLLMHLTLQFAFNAFYFRKQYSSLIISTIASITTLSLLSKYLLSSIYHLQLNTGFFFLIYLCLTLGWYGLHLIISGHRKQLLLSAAANAKLESELNILRAQIKPHFFFNTLQNIYSTNFFDQQKANDMILALSDLMRYHIDFASLQCIKVEKEIAVIHQYIELEKLRLKPVDNIIVNISIPENNYSIPPLILLTQVENSFKHGVGINPCTIEISILLDGKTLHLITKNTLHKKNVTDDSMVANSSSFVNTKKQLELNYPGRHIFEVHHTETDFILNLQLSLA